MSLPTSIDAYDAELDYFQQAFDDPDGIRLSFTTYGEANLFVMRMHQARALQRQLHRRLYTSDDPKHGRSEFDRLMVRQPRYDDVQHGWVYIERSNARVVSVESLGQLSEAPDA